MLLTRWHYSKALRILEKQPSFNQFQFYDSEGGCFVELQFISVLRHIRGEEGVQQNDDSNNKIA